MEELVTTAEVARRFGVTPQAVQRWVVSGALTPVQKLSGVRGAYLFTEDAVAAYKASQGAS